MTFFLGFSLYMILHNYSLVICLLVSSPTPTPTTFPLISLWSHTGIYLTFNLIISRVTHTRRLRTTFKIGAFKTRHLVWFSPLKPKEKVWIKWNYLENRRLIRTWNVLATVFFLYQNTKLLNISVIITHTSTYTLRRYTTKYFIETETKWVSHNVLEFFATKTVKSLA